MLEEVQRGPTDANSAGNVSEDLKLDSESGQQLGNLIIHNQRPLLSEMKDRTKRTHEVDAAESRALDLAQLRGNPRDGRGHGGTLPSGEDCGGAFSAKAIGGVCEAHGVAEILEPAAVAVVAVQPTSCMQGVDRRGQLHFVHQTTCPRQGPGGRWRHAWIYDLADESVHQAPLLLRGTGLSHISSGGQGKHSPDICKALCAGRQPVNCSRWP